MSITIPPLPIDVPIPRQIPTAFSDVLTGTAGNDTISALAGNDIIIGNAGNDVINGGDGRDFAVFTGARAQYAVTLSGSSTTVRDTVGGRDGTDTLSATERALFSDGTLCFDTTGIAGQAYRVYQAAFARTPDTPGLAFWINQMDNGASHRSVAQGFLQSTEFRNVYGSSLTDLAFVSALYSNILGRAGEAAGVTFWTGELTSGRADRASVLSGFSDSSENVVRVSSAVSSGIWLAGYDLS